MDKIEELKKKITDFQAKSAAKEEIKALIAIVIPLINKSKEEISQLNAENIKVIKDSIAYIQENYPNWKDTNDEIKSMVNTFNENISIIDELVKKVKDIKPIKGEDGIDGINGLDGKDGKDGSPDTPNEIVDKLNTLEEVIDQKVIKGLVKKISDISLNIAHGAIKEDAKLYTGISETRALELIRNNDTLEGLIYVPYTGATTNVDLGANNLTVDTNTFFVNATTNRVSVGTTSPTYKLEVSAGGSDDVFKIASTRNIVTQAQMLMYSNKGTNSANNDRALIVFNHDKSDNSGVMASAIGSRVFSAASSTGLGLAFATGGTSTDDMVLDNSGNLGIGTTTPVNRLSIDGINVAAATTGSAANGIVRLIPNGSTAVMDIGMTGQSTHAWIQSRSGSNYATNYGLSLNPNGGNVGIGIATAGSALHIQGLEGAATNGGTPNGINWVGSSTTNIILASGVTGTGGTHAWLQSENKTSATYYALALNPLGGRIGIGTIAPDGANANVLLDVRGHIRAALSSTVGTYYFSSAATNPYLSYGSVTDAWTFSDNNSHKVTVTSGGRMGIGVTAPTAKLSLTTDGAGDGTFLTNGILIRQSNAVTAGEAAISFQDATATTTNYWIQGLNQSSKFSLAYGSSFSDANTKMTVLTTGEVGIGTVTPDEELVVYGTTDTVLKIQAVGARSDANTPSPRLYFAKDITSGTVTANDDAGIILVSSDDASNNIGNSHQIKFSTSGVTAGAVTTDIIFQTVNATSIGTLSTVLTLQGSRLITAGNIELGHTTDTTLSRVSAGVIAVEGVTIATASNTLTLTNKRRTRRLTTTNAPGATPTTNTDNVDVMNFTGLGTAITSMTTNLSGTPVDGDLLEFRFTDDGTGRAITWGASFSNTTVTAPIITVASTMLRVFFEYNGSTWACVGTA